MVNSKRKKIIISLAAIYFLSFFFGLSFTGTEASENRVTIQTVNGEPGQTVSVDVTASAINMAGFTFVINYDPEYLEPKDAELYIGTGGLTENLEYGSDKMKFNWFVAENMVVNQMFKIEFEVIKEINGVTGIYIDPADNENEVLRVVGGFPTEIEVVYVAGGVSGNGGIEEGCYIATAVYGSYNAEEVIALRNFRDDVLKGSPAGRLFIEAYYALSPPVAAYLAEAESLNSWVKKILDSFVGFLNQGVNQGDGSLDAF